MYHSCTSFSLLWVLVNELQVCCWLLLCGAGRWSYSREMPSESQWETSPPIHAGSSLDNTSIMWMPDWCAHNPILEPLALIRIILSFCYCGCGDLSGQGSVQHSNAFTTTMAKALLWTVIWTHWNAGTRSSPLASLKLNLVCVRKNLNARASKDILDNFVFSMATVWVRGFDVNKRW